MIGFLALCLMQFRIGPDLGLALAKGVALSLITVFTFMPALILKTYKIIDKTEHRSLSFVSEKNTHVNAVQFVIKTAAIEKAEVPLDDAGESAPLTFWQKLLRLVGLYA